MPEDTSKSPVENVEISENKQKTTATPTKTPLPVSTKQVETRTSDGRRRITPICVAPAPDIGYVYEINILKNLSAFVSSVFLYLRMSKSLCEKYE